MMSPQCGTCGAYYTGNEAYCARCGAPRATTAYQQNPYGQPAQNPYGQPAQQQSSFGNRLQGYFTPQRIVQRWIIGRIIGLAVVVLVFGGCVVCVLLGGLGSALSGH